MSDVAWMPIVRQHIAQICFQHPANSFYLLSLITNRLLADTAIMTNRPPTQESKKSRE
jgi:hypothetical protein